MPSNKDVHKKVLFANRNYYQFQYQSPNYHFEFGDMQLFQEGIR